MSDFSPYNQKNDPRRVTKTPRPRPHLGDLQVALRDEALGFGGFEGLQHRLRAPLHTPRGIGGEAVAKRPPVGVEGTPFGNPLRKWRAWMVGKKVTNQDVMGSENREWETQRTEIARRGPRCHVQPAKTRSSPSEKTVLGNFAGFEMCGSKVDTAWHGNQRSETMGNK